jgi:hypothetical protein
MTREEAAVAAQKRQEQMLCLALGGVAVGLVGLIFRSLNAMESQGKRAAQQRQEGIMDDSPSG